MPVVRPKGMSAPAESSTSEPGSKSSEMRGYKLTADGRKVFVFVQFDIALSNPLSLFLFLYPMQTTFFNNDLDDEAKALIGDIRPKKLDDAALDADSSNIAVGSSVWNTAGTWEERSMTAWGKERLTELLVGVEVSYVNNPYQSLIITCFFLLV